MTRTVVQKIKGHHYLYEVGSEWDPDTGRMKQKRRYIGKCDASGNLLSGKREESESFEFGQFYLLSEIARRCGVQGMLEEVLGRTAGRYMTAVAIIRSLRITSPVLVGSILKKSVLSNIYGLGFDDGWGDVASIVRHITELYDRRREIFPKLAEPGDTEVFELNSFESEFNFLDIIEGDRDYGFNTMPRMTVYIAHSKNERRPTYFYMAPSGVSRTVSVPHMMGDMGAEGRCSFFFNASGIRLKEVLSILSSGIRATFRTGPDDPLGRRVRTLMEEPNEREYVTHIMDGGIYRVCEQDTDLDGTPIRLFRIVDERKRMGEIKTLHKYVDGILRISGYDIPDDEKLQLAYNSDFKDVLNAISFDHNEEGALTFSLNRYAMFEKERRCGLTVYVSTGDVSWEDVLSMSRSRDAYEHDLDVFKTDLEEGTNLFPSTHDGVANFIDDFLAMRIRNELKHLIARSPMGGKVTYLDVLGEMMGLRITWTSGRWILDELTDGQRAMFEALGVDIPDQRTVMGYRNPE